MADNNVTDLKDLVPQEALNKLNELNQVLGVSTANLAKMLPEIQAVNKELSKSGLNYKELTVAVDKAATVEKKLTAEEKERQRLLAEKERLTQRVVQAYSVEAMEVEKLRQTMNQISVVRRNIIKEQMSQSGSTAELRAQINLLNNSLDQMSAKTRNSAIGKAMVEDVKKLTLMVSELEQQTGRFQRNVGNYASGWNGLGNSVNQIVRELPAAKMGINMFFLAISNNLPILTDEIKKAKTEFAALKAEGKDAVPVWQQLVKSLVSWQTAMMVGITILTMYGKEIINWTRGIFSASEANDALKSLYKKVI